MHLFGVMSFAEEAETVDHWQPPLFFGLLLGGSLGCPNYRSVDFFNLYSSRWITC